MIVLVRCDDRLIHGQSMTVIVKEYKINNIIVIDPTTAANPILRTIFQKAVPAAIHADVYNVDGAIPAIEKALTDGSTTEILMKEPQPYAELLEKVEGIPKTLNVGPMSAHKGTIRVNPAINVLPAEGEALKKAVSLGAEVYFQQVPSQQRIDWDQVADQF